MPREKKREASSVSSIRQVAEKRRGGALPPWGNTGPLTPLECSSALGPLLLQARVDALTLAFRVRPAQTEVARMIRTLGTAERAGYEVNGEEFELRQIGGRTQRFLLTNATAAFCVGEDQNDFCITADVRALSLQTTPLASAIDHAQTVAQHFAATPFGEVRVRRLDLCADATGLTFSREDEDKFVTRARNKVRFQAPEKVFTRKHDGDGYLTGFVIAPGNEISIRIYDKTEELLTVHGKDSEKTRTELATFRRGGWDGDSSVWRVEVQMRSKVLQELNAASPERLLKVVDSVWHYAVGSEDPDSKAWLRLVDRNSATRVERCDTNERWRTYQAARFSGRDPVERVPGSGGGVSPEQALGSVLSVLGATSNLSKVQGKEAPHELIRRDFQRAADLIAARPHLLRSYRRRRAAARGRYFADAIKDEA